MVNLSKTILLKKTTLHLIIITFYHCQNCIITLESF